MMKKQVAGIVLAVSIIGGVGTGVVANALVSDDPATATSDGKASDPTPAPEESSDSADDSGDGAGESGMEAPDQLTVIPGAVGPVRAGMSKADALETGYFVADVPAPADGCPVRPLSWKDEYVNTYDVQTLGNGEISSIGIFGDGVLTDQGVGVGSTYDEVSAAYPEETLVEAGYLQAGIRTYDTQNGGWVGFLFDTSTDEIKGSDEVTFMEVTQGGEPSLMRDGC